MARRTIPLKEKETVKRRLAVGMSSREAVKGLKMHDTTALELLKNNRREIQQIREEYLQMIRTNGADLPQRAKKWAEMTFATRGDEPDWQARRDALKYIDQMEGLSKADESVVTLNTLNLVVVRDEPTG